MYRLNVLNLRLPPLRERPEDISLLSTLFVDRAAKQIGCKPPALTGEATHILQEKSWPGNVRQLENLLFRTVALCQNGAIDKEELHNAGINVDTKSIHSTTEPESWKAAQTEFEKELLNTFYPRYPSSRKLAQRLGVSHTTIADKLRAHNISLPKD